MAARLDPSFADPKYNKMSPASIASVSEEFSEDDLQKLKSNPDHPKHLSMSMIGMITLEKASPFKLSERQKSSLAAFMQDRWPKKGDGSEIVRDDVELFESFFSSSSVSVNMAFGFMTVMGAWSAAIRVKLSKLLIKRPSDIGKL